MMSPDTLESRFAALKQRVDDVVELFTGRLKDVETDVATLNLLAREVGQMHSDVTRCHESVRELKRDADALHHRLDDAEKQRQERFERTVERERQEREARAKEQRERRDEFAREQRARKLMTVSLIIAAVGMIVTAIGVMATVI